MVESIVNWSEVQGLVQGGYSKLPHAIYLFVNLDSERPESGSSWLRQWKDELSYSAPGNPNVARDAIESAVEKGQSHDSNTDIIINLGFTATGLRKLGLKQSDLRTFSTEFTDGMHNERATHVLGDCGDNHPSNWAWGNDRHPVDVVVIVYGCCERSLEKKLRDIESSLHWAGHRRVFKMSARWEQKEHFGFKDGISDPIIRGQIRQRSTSSVDPSGPVHAGEFIFGYINDRGEKPPSPSVGTADSASRLLQPSNTQVAWSDANSVRYDFGLNGTLMVIRQLSQDTQNFEQYVESVVQVDEVLSNAIASEQYSFELCKDYVKARMMGRWPDGVSVSSAPTIERWLSVQKTLNGKVPKNDFGYATSDRHGYGCPLGSHVRRALPRDGLGESPTHSLRISNRHRILRRGRIYGGGRYDGTTDRGMMFVCFNAQLSGQFEFVHRNWLNNNQFVGADFEVDPIVGPVNEHGARSFSIQGRPTRRMFSDLKQFVTVRGGAYFFVPSASAIDYLIQCNIPE